MKKQKISQANSGFSLVEVLVAVGLLSIVSLSLLAVLDSTNKGQKRAMNRDNLLNLTNTIRSSLTDAALCRQAFIFNLSASSNFPVAPTIGTNYALDRVTAFGRDLVVTNAAVPGTVDIATPATSSATGLRLELANSAPSATPGFTNWDATLVIPLVVTNQTGMRDMTVNFLITTDNLAPTIIASCNAMASGTTDQTVCENIMGGVYDISRNPMCRLQQTLVSNARYRDQLTVVPAGSFLAVETPAGSRGISSFGPGARIGLYPTETDFASTPANGVGLTIPANNQLQINATQGILNDGYLHITRDATGPAFAMKLTNSVSGLDVFTLDRVGRLSANTALATAWNNFGASTVVGDILRVYDNAGTTQVSVEATGDVNIGPNAGTGKLDVRSPAPGGVINWGNAGGIIGSLIAAPGIAGIASTAGNALSIQSATTGTFQTASNLTLSSGTNLALAATTITAASGSTTMSSTGTTTINAATLNVVSGSTANISTTSDLTISTQSGGNTLIFSAVDADFSRNVNAPTFNNVSDQRLKTNIVKMESVLEKLLQVQSYSYVFKSDSNKEKHFGFIAQELQKIYPNLVRENKSGYLSVNYIEVVPLLVEALRESEQRNRELESRVDQLESSMKNIEQSLKGSAWKNHIHR